MHEYTLVRVGGLETKETVVGTFKAATTKDACIKHMKAWNERPTHHAVVLVLPNGERNSYRDSDVYVRTEV